MRDTWQNQLLQGFSTPAQLLDYLELPSDFGSTKANQQFVTRVPRRFVDKMEKGNRHDPLLLQVLPQQIELDSKPGFSPDPLVERAANPTPGILHKYHGRVLLTLSGACAVNCRYCFRRHFPYQDNALGNKKLTQALDYIRQDSSIREVILSGGDPLMVKNKALSVLLANLEVIPHVTTLRIHSRIPIVLPERIDTDFLAILDGCHLEKVMVVHCNHAQELDEVVANCCKQLKQHGVHVLNQSVLLKGVNDAVDTLVDLSRALFRCGILPYYLHLLDKVDGAAHFDVDSQRAISLHRAMLERLPGYLVPKLVTERFGEKSKSWVG